MEDMDEEWKRRKEGGILIGNEKIFGFKFADDVTLVVDTVEEWQNMLIGLERYTDKNWMELNKDKTKELICRNGGRVKKGKMKV